MKTVVDREQSIGCWLCVHVCPEVFEMDDVGSVAVKIESVLPDVRKSCGEAGMECPVLAIHV